MSQAGHSALIKLSPVGTCLTAADLGAYHPAMSMSRAKNQHMVPHLPQIRLLFLYCAPPSLPIRCALGAETIRRREYLRCPAAGDDFYPVRPTPTPRTATTTLILKIKV
jgi:hypothetical protein